MTDPQKARITSETLFSKEFIYENQKYTMLLGGAHQTENAVNAVEAAKALGVSGRAIADGLSKTKMIARMEVIGENPLIIRDGGHNEGCALALRSFLIKNKVGNIRLLIGMMADKDVEAYVGSIAPLCKAAVTVTPSNPRAVNAGELMKITEKYCKSCKAVNDPKDGYEYILSSAEKNDAVLVCGSFYLMSDIFGEG